MTDTPELDKGDGRTHIVKSWPHLFAETLAGRKHHELRRNDRGYKVGDILLLQEFDPERQAYTGRELRQRISYITSPDTPCAASETALADDFCILSLRPAETEEAEELAHRLDEIGARPSSSVSAVATEAAALLRRQASDLAMYRDSNMRDFRIAVERSCDEHLSSLKHELRAAEAEVNRLEMALRDAQGEVAYLREGGLP